MLDNPGKKGGTLIKIKGGENMNIEFGMIHTLTVVINHLDSELKQYFMSKYSRSFEEIQKIDELYFDGVSYHLMGNDSHVHIFITFDLIKMMDRLTNTQEDVERVYIIMARIEEELQLEKDTIQLNRIDYKIDVKVEDEVKREILIKLFSKGLTKYNRRVKQIINSNSVQYISGSIKFTMYDKNKQRAYRYQEIYDYEQNIIRFECAVQNPALKYQKYRYKVPKSVEIYFTEEKMREYIAKAIPMYFATGHFYTLSNAIKRIESSDFSKVEKKHLCEFLTYTGKHGLDASRKRYRGQSKTGRYDARTYKKYILQLEELKINSILLSARDSRILKQNCLINPFANEFEKLLKEK